MDCRRSRAPATDGLSYSTVCSCSSSQAILHAKYLRNRKRWNGTFPESCEGIYFIQKQPCFITEESDLGGIRQYRGGSVPL